MDNIGIHTEPQVASVIKAPIKFDLAGECGITVDSFINADGESVYRLKTIDYVANEWNEYFGSLSLALMRVATLTAIIESDKKHETSLSFKHDSTVFADKAYAFIDGELA